MSDTEDPMTRAAAVERYRELRLLLVSATRDTDVLIAEALQLSRVYDLPAEGWDDETAPRDADGAPLVEAPLSPRAEALVRRAISVEHGEDPSPPKRPPTLFGDAKIEPRTWGQAEAQRQKDVTALTRILERHGVARRQLYRCPKCDNYRVQGEPCVECDKETL